MTKEERLKVTEFVNYYKNQDKKISFKESEIKALTIEIEGMLNELVQKRKEEQLFMIELENKYGSEGLVKIISKLEQ